MRRSAAVTLRLTSELPGRGKGLSRGFSMIELVVVLTVCALLAAVTYPSFQTAILKARRSEALASLALLQMAQERHRSNHTAYASLDQLGLPPGASGRYRFSEETPTAQGFSILASAQGAQVADASCRHLALQVDGLETRWASGPDTALANGEQDNRRCWGL